MLADNRFGHAIRMILSLAMAGFHLYVVFFGPPQTTYFRGTHLAFAMVLTGLCVPAFPSKSKVGALVSNMADIALMVSALVSIGYLFVNLDYVLTRFPYFDELRIADYICGTLLVAAVLEGTRRTTGIGMPLCAMLFIAYSYFVVDLSWGEILDQLYMTNDGIFGIPLTVAATYILLFVVFGALVEKSGTGKLFMDFALAVAGTSAGGPAKVAVMTSASFGTISGSSTANVVTTGTFTIPLMMRTGYRPGYAGAVEAVASTGGQIMPPIMGAAAFVMAEFLGTSYLAVVVMAIIPALLYFFAVFMAVHFEAKRLGLKGMPRADVPSMAKVVIERGHQILPLVFIVVVLVMGYSAPYAATIGLVSVIPVALMRKTTRSAITFKSVIEGVVVGIRNSLQVTAACACAGIVIGMIALSGIGFNFTSFLMSLASTSMLLALILTAIAGIILGMGLPTTPAYVVQAALMIPALVKLGVIIPAAHMFVIYFAVISSITPPVAITLIAACGLSGAGLWESSIASMKLAATGYIVPFMFVYGPALLFIGEPGTVAVSCVTAIIGVTALSAGLNGYFLKDSNWFERIILIAAAFLMIKTGLTTDLLGVALIVAIGLIQTLTKRKDTVAVEN